jgi:hypothetical protein
MLMSGSWKLLLFLLAGGVLGAVFARLRQRWLISRTESWPEVEGAVVTTNVIDQNAEGALAEIGYSYSVMGSQYGGSIRRHFVLAQQAWDFANGCKNMKILVHYNPNRPEASVVWETIH